MGSFSLQRILELKRRREEASAVRLVEARATADEARRAEAALDHQLREGVRQRAAGAGVASVGQLQNSSYLLERLDQRLGDARAALAAAEADVSARLAEFTKALEERRVLDRLREKRTEAAAAEEVRMDQNRMDAIALTRFVRAETRDREGDL